MKYAVRLEFKVLSLGQLNFSYIRPEYAENNLESATLFDSLEAAENAADVQFENMRSFAVTIRAKFIPVE